MGFSTILSFAAALLSGSLAIFALYRDRRSFIHWTFAVGMIALALEALLNGVSVQAQLAETVIRWQRIRFLVGGFIPPIWLLFALSFTRENYIQSLERVKWLLVSCFGIPVVLGMGFNSDLIRGAMLNESSVWILGLGWPGYFLQVFVLLMVVIVLMNLERTLRASSGHVRWQIKFMIVGLGSLFAVRIYTGGEILLFRSVDMGLEVVNACTLIVAGALMIRSLLRLRVLSVDFYPSQTVLYSAFTLVLVGAYFIVVGVLANLVKYFDGGQSFAARVFLVFLAFLGISILLLSDRFRHKIKRFIAIQLKRPQYDYRREWVRFTEKTATITDVRNLCMAVARMVSDTLEVLSVTVWLIDEPHARLRPVGSTVFSETGTGHRISEEGEAKLVQAMRDQKMPVDLDDPNVPWADDLKLSMPDGFREARIRYCVPLSAGENLLGVVTLGERVEYKPFSFEEFDLLKTIVDQTAASLLNLMLSEDLRKTKEMEAFQTMSAFVLHDLKNLSFSLSLTMQNLPIHFENPDFRNDALRTIQGSVAKINDICGHLSVLSKKIELKRTEIDLNELTESTLRSLNGCVQGSLLKTLQPIPRVSGDPEQIEKVLTNLILNANDAAGNGGEIQVSTGQREGWIVLSVVDNGCGISKEFLERCLFLPFKTTKKGGMGIGLFHSKRIVEAHQGRIEVESEEGKGSTFRVMLPLAGK
jgi:putative PEP-CTERM system histidine kinase